MYQRETTTEKKSLLLILILFVNLIIMSTSIILRSGESLFQTIISSMFSPVQIAFQKSIDFFSHEINHYIFLQNIFQKYHKLKGEHKNLKYENYLLRKQLSILKFNSKAQKKGDGFIQPLKPHEHWHCDISYINICGTFYYLCSILDGFSRYIVHWEIRESMTERDVEIVLQRAREKFPNAKPRIISDNGPQFISKDFKEFIRISGMTHVRTSPYYPQSNGKLERYHKTIKGTCIRVRTPLSLEDARDIVADFVDHYNTRRLHSAIGYITPRDKLEGRAETVLAGRDAKLAAARQARKVKRKAS